VYVAEDADPLPDEVTHLNQQAKVKQVLSVVHV